MKTTSFVPAHITGFFEIYWDEDILKTGARGAGVVIDKGAYTTVEVRKGEGITIFVDGKPCECQTTKSVIKSIRISEECNVNVSHRTEVPVKYGFGVSGAGALGAALALNRVLNLGMDITQCGEIAHHAEVINKTGLGDVIAEITGGLVIRMEPGAPGIGKTKVIPCEDYIVAFLVGEEMETKAILGDPKKIRDINRIGRGCVKLLQKKPTVNNFLRLSKYFAFKTGLMSKKVYSVIKNLERKGIPSSMVMLGNAVFTITSRPEKVIEKVDYKAILSGIDTRGGRII